MKANSRFLEVIIVITLAFAPHLQAQILAQFYNEDGGQTLATVTDFENAGVVGLTGSETVLGFNIGATFNYNGSAFSLTSGPITVNKGGSGFSYPGNSSPIYQQTLLDTDNISITGLDGVLKSNTTYNLYLFANSITFNPPAGTGGTMTDNTFTYGAQSGFVDNVNTVGGTTIPFTFTTGSTPTGTLVFSVVGSAINPADYPGISGFAIVAAVPEPSTYAMFAWGLGALVFYVIGFRRKKSPQALNP